MGDDTNATGLPRDHVRIEGTLDWYFNFADADLGLRSNHAATVAFLVNACERAVASSDAAEDDMFRAVEAVRRFRGVSEIVNRLGKRDQRDLQRCFTRRRCPPELASRPLAQRWFAATSPAVRGYLQSRGREEWTLAAGEQLLSRALGTSADQHAELVGIRTEAWTFAELAVNALLCRYADAERDEARARAERRAKLSAPLRGRNATDRRPS